VARQHTIHYLRPTFADELLRVVTWLGPVQGAKVERAYRVFRVQPLPDKIPVAGRSLQEADDNQGEELVCKASTEWVFVSETGHPRRIPADIATQFARVASNGALVR
jgi:acyl-CoA thioesterase FadM